MGRCAARLIGVAEKDPVRQVAAEPSHHDSTLSEIHRASRLAPRKLHGRYRLPKFFCTHQRIAHFAHRASGRERRSAREDADDAAGTRDRTARRVADRRGENRAKIALRDRHTRRLVDPCDGDAS